MQTPRHVAITKRKVTLGLRPIHSKAHSNTIKGRGGPMESGIVTLPNFTLLYLDLY